MNGWLWVCHGQRVSLIGVLGLGGWIKDRHSLRWLRRVDLWREEKLQIRFSLSPSLNLNLVIHLQSSSMSRVPKSPHHADIHIWLQCWIRGKPPESGHSKPQRHYLRNLTLATLMRQIGYPRKGIDASQSHIFWKEIYKAAIVTRHYERLFYRALN